MWLSICLCVSASLYMCCYRVGLLILCTSVHICHIDLPIKWFMNVFIINTTNNVCLIYFSGWARRKWRNLEGNQRCHGSTGIHRSPGKHRLALLIRYYFQIFPRYILEVLLSAPQRSISDTRWFIVRVHYCARVGLWVTRFWVPVYSDEEYN